LFPTPASFFRGIVTLRFAIWAGASKQAYTARRLAQPADNYDSEDHEERGEQQEDQSEHKISSAQDITRSGRLWM
jgi:hypothetical protein